MTSAIVPERCVERVFHLHCSCGATLVSTERTVQCDRCGKTLEVRRVRKRTRSPIEVNYNFQCCFCSAALTSTKKTATCTSCGKTLHIIRGERHSRRQATSSSYDRGKVWEEWFVRMCLGLVLFCYILSLIVLAVHASDN